MTRFLLLSLCLTGVLSARADEPAGAWKFDQLRLKNGLVHRGLILEQTPTIIRFQDVRRKPGRPTVCFHTTFLPDEIDSLERLDDADREQLKRRLLELSEGPNETERMARVTLERRPWSGKVDGGLYYRSDCFELSSNAPEAVVRQAIVRLEQIYSAFDRFLPSGVLRASPTRIELFRSQDEYLARLRSQGRQFQNAAYFDPVENRIACASEVAKAGEELETARVQFQELRAELDRRETALQKLYKGAELARILKPLRDARAEYDKTERQIAAAFDRTTKQMFATLYHEAFHAYSAAFAESTGRPAMPRWLSEGLAQIFETAIVEAGELRIDHADGDRLRRVKDAVRKGELMPIGRLLAADAQQFAAAHATDRAVSDSFYLGAWAAAFHLTFERRLVGAPRFDEYMRDAASGMNPLAAFEKLVGQPVADYDAALRAYLLKLQSDGTVGK